jgi:hypothetical protein
MRFPNQVFFLNLCNLLNPLPTIIALTDNSTDYTDSVERDNPGTFANPIDFVDQAKPPEPFNPAGLANYKKPDNPAHLTKRGLPARLLT